MEREVYDPYDTGSLAFREYHARMANEIISVSMAHTHPLYSVMEGESHRSVRSGSVWLTDRAGSFSDHRLAISLDA
jgi:hypothetical protein